MQASHNVEFCDGFAVAGSRCLEGLFERHCVGTRRILLSPESAQAAGSDTYICRIDMTIHVEIGFIAVKSLADMVRQPADRQNIPSTIQGQSFVSIEAFASQHLLMDWDKAGIVGLE
jgi:hypothetical protein